MNLMQEPGEPVDDRTSDSARADRMLCIGLGFMAGVIFLWAAFVLAMAGSRNAMPLHQPLTAPTIRIIRCDLQIHRDVRDFDAAILQAISVEPELGPPL